MYRNSRCAVKIGNCRTVFFQQGRGVRQGCSLSPTLFNIYINELAEALDRSGNIPGIALHDSEVKCLLYADDLVLMSPKAEGLQHSLTLLEQYCESWCSRRRPGLREADTSSVTEEKFWSTAPTTLTWASRSLHRGASVWL